MRASVLTCGVIVLGGVPGAALAQSTGADVSVVVSTAPACSPVLGQQRYVGVQRCADQLRMRCPQLRGTWHDQRRLAFARVSATLVRSNAMARSQPGLWVAAQNCLRGTRTLDQLSSRVHRVLAVWVADRNHAALVQCVRHCEVDTRTRAQLIEAERTERLLIDSRAHLKRFEMEFAARRRRPVDVAGWLRMIDTKVDKVSRPLRHYRRADFVRLRRRMAEFTARVAKQRGSIVRAAMRRATAELFRHAADGRRVAARSKRRSAALRAINTGARVDRRVSALVTHYKGLVRAQRRRYRAAKRAWSRAEIALRRILAARPRRPPPPFRQVDFEPLG